MAAFFILKLLSFIGLLSHLSEQQVPVNINIRALEQHRIIFPGDPRLQIIETTTAGEINDLSVYHNSEYAKPLTIDNRLVADFASQLNEFHKKLTYTVLSNNPGKNIIYSPISVTTLLMMIALGARGSSQFEILVNSGLSFDDRIIKGFPDLIKILKDIKGVQLSIANRVFAHEDEGVQLVYQKNIEDILHSQLQIINFRDTDSTAKIVNNWCQNQTNNHITEITTPDELSDASLILVNAVYFKGDWKIPFNVSDTMNNVPFYIDDVKTVYVSMMRLQDSFNWGMIQELNTIFIELPYAGDEDDEETFSMYLLVPKEINGLALLENNIKLIDFKFLNYYEDSVIVSLPKFKIQNTLQLKPILEKIGIQKIFGKSADLRAIINNRKLHVNKIIQKAFLEVNEKGSEAAALTESEFNNRQGPGVVTADRPFLCAIVLKKLGIPLFYARVVDPTKLE